MLDRAHRLTKDIDFEKLAKSGRAVYGGELALKWRKNDLAQSRFGFVISTKVSKKAVVRNKIKRRMRAIVRLSLSKIKPGYDIMILTRTEIVKLSYAELKSKLELLLKQASLL
ncbi:MAG: ribonuclease P protein component [Patescibacteria group bacterium]|nr:ribonuclease P protein component [Patescibacteria group bacterium]MDD5121084.1 ribonuclease P protein component [Patescibacteria group bacterium]MDD5221986.1 ribonuclease P protein component [Patescibacteria group bacterium]MDD5395997.1 ribonuclease P protein component [Patescibacteria group bacterium]